VVRLSPGAAVPKIDDSRSLARDENRSSPIIIRVGLVLLLVAVPVNEPPLTVTVYEPGLGTWD